MLYHQLTFHKIYYHKFQLTGGIMYCVLFDNWVRCQGIWLWFEWISPLVTHHYWIGAGQFFWWNIAIKNKEMSFSRQLISIKVFSWTWLVFSILFVADLMTKFQIEKCDLDVWFKFIPVLFYYFHADMFMLHTWCCMIKQRKIKKNPLNWTAKHPNLVTFHF